MPASSSSDYDNTTLNQQQASLDSGLSSLQQDASPPSATDTRVRNLVLVLLCLTIFSIAYITAQMTSSSPEPSQEVEIATGASSALTADIEPEKAPAVDQPLTTNTPSTGESQNTYNLNPQETEAVLQRAYKEAGINCESVSRANRQEFFKALYSAGGLNNQFTTALEETLKNTKACEFEDKQYVLIRVSAMDEFVSIIVEARAQEEGFNSEQQQEVCQLLEDPSGLFGFGEEYSNETVVVGDDLFVDPNGDISDLKKALEDNGFKTEPYIPKLELGFC